MLLNLKVNLGQELDNFTDANWTPTTQRPRCGFEVWLQPMVYTVVVESERWIVFQTGGRCGVLGATYRPFLVTIISLVNSWNLLQRSRSSSATRHSRSIPLDGSVLTNPRPPAPASGIPPSAADRMCCVWLLLLTCRVDLSISNRILIRNSAPVVKKKSPPGTGFNKKQGEESPLALEKSPFENHSSSLEQQQ